MSILFLSPASRDASSELLGREILREATAVVPAGAGELIQGQFATGEDFLVTNPVSCFSTIQVSIRPGSGVVTVSPASCTKAQKAVEQTLCIFQVIDLDVEVRISSTIPVGKGMASSTADVVGAIEATARAIEREITAEQISAIAVSIEPSDGLMYRGIVIYNHRRGHLLERLGHLPEMHQVIIDTGGEIDTIAFNRTPKNYAREELALQAQALALLREGLATGDVMKIGRSATLSARVNQRLLPKAHFDEVMSIADACGACGVVCAHSGTILSLLFALENAPGLARAKAIFQRKEYPVLHTHSITTW